MNIGTYIDSAVKKFADSPYLTFYDKTYTYTEISKKINILANALKKQGFKKGDFIHVWVQNSPETLIAYYAIIKIGAVAGPINGWWKGPEVKYLLNDSGGCGLIVEDQYLPIYNEIKDQCPHLKTVILVGKDPVEGMIPFDSLTDQGDETPVVCESDVEDTAFIFTPPAPPEIPKAFCSPTKTWWPTPTASTRP